MTSRRFTGLLATLLVFAWAILAAQAQSSQPAEVEPDGSAGEAENAPDESKATEASSQEYDFRTTRYLLGNWAGARKELEDDGFKFELTYQQQFQQNFRGGLSTNNGHRFSGTYDMAFELDFAKMKLIPGGSFYFKAKGGYSDGINPDKVGALGNVNGDAFDDKAIFVRKWWYRQVFFEEKLEFRVGRLQTNKDLFDISLYANHEDKDFLNTFSVRNATIPHVNGIGAFARVQPVKWLYVQAGAFDGQAVDRTRTGFDTAFHDDARWIGMWEAGVLPRLETSKGPMPGSYRVGFWYDPRSRNVFMNTLEGRRCQRVDTESVGFYLGADQMIWKETHDPKDTQGLGLFARLGSARETTSRTNCFWQLGASCKGLLPERDDDVTALSVSQSILSQDYREFVNERADRETIYEWYYQVQLFPWMTIAPNIQVITNPGGDKDDRDSLVGGVRVRIVF